MWLKKLPARLHRHSVRETPLRRAAELEMANKVMKAVSG